MAKNLILEKTFAFSLMIIEVYKKLIEKNEYIISKQIFRSGTSIGANVAEAQGGTSKRDFKNKISISLKEALETRYWLLLLRESRLVEINIDRELKEIESLISLLFKIIKTTAANLKQISN